MKIRELVGDLTYQEIKSRKWRIPRLWKNGEKILFNDYVISEDGIIFIAKKRIPKIHKGRRYKISSNIGSIVSIYSNNGYIYTTLYVNIDNRSNYDGRIKIHRLMWETWIGKIPDKFQINHKDGNRGNNLISNLEAVTAKENVDYAMKMGIFLSKEHRKKISEAQKGRVMAEKTKKKISLSLLSKTGHGPSYGTKRSLETRKKLSLIASRRIGEKNSRARFSQDEVDNLRKLFFKDNYSICELERFFSISNSTLRRALFGETYNEDGLTDEELAEKALL